MLQDFCNHIQTEFSFLKNKKLLLAISGGIDSVVITHLLNDLKFSITLAHCNFNLRGEESNADELFVKKLAKKLNLKVFTTHFNTIAIAQNKKKSIQVVARELRYNWFENLMQKYNFDYVVTAHHADDNLETFLINLTRGTGLDGLTGIPKQNKHIVRPLLAFSRERIQKYAIKNKINWREDTSNSSTKYIRNKIRHKVIPVLKEINPSLLNSFSKTVENLTESKTIINDKVNDVSKKTLRIFNLDQNSRFIKLNISEIQKLSNPKIYLYQLLKEYNFSEWNDVVNLLTAQSGKRIFSKSHTLLKDRDVLLLYSNSYLKFTDTVFYIDKHQNQLTKPIQLSLEKLSKNTKSRTANTIYIDRNSIKFPLQIRKWQAGDVFYPVGMKGKKKLSKYFKDQKMSLLEKENTWILCTAKNEIIWVINHRQDARFIQKEESSKILKLTTKNLF